MNCKVLTLAACGLGLALAAEAGVLIKQRSETIGRPGITETTLAVEPDRLRAENIGSDSHTIFLYLAAEEAFYMINMKQGTYQRMTRQQMEQMVNQASEAMRKMEEQLSKMSPQQRAMVERMMKGQLGQMQGTVEQTRFNKVAAGVPVRQWSCDQYEGRRGGEKVQDVWTTSWGALNLNAGDFRVFREMAGIFEGLATRAGTQFPRFSADDTPVEGEYSGLPVRTLLYQNGKPHLQTDIIEVSRRMFADADFQAPPGLREEQVPGGGAASPRQPASRPAPQRPSPPSPPSPPPAPAPATAAAPPAPAPVPAADCSTALRQYRSGEADADLVRQACPAEVAAAALGN